MKLKRVTQYATTLLFIFSVVLCFSGCGDNNPRNCTISGEVTLDGKPVKEGSISFEITEEGDLPSGAMIVEGVYTAELTPGHKIVRISAPDIDAGMSGSEEEGGMYPELIPPKYEETPLEIDVTKSDTVNFSLTSD